MGRPAGEEGPPTVLSVALDDGTTVSVLHGESTDTHSLAVDRPDGGPLVTRDFGLRADSMVTPEPGGERFGVAWTISSDAVGADLKIEFAGKGREILLADTPYRFGRCRVTGTIGDRRAEGMGHVYIRSSSGTPEAGG